MPVTGGEPYTYHMSLNLGEWPSAANDTNVLIDPTGRYPVKTWYIVPSPNTPGALM